MLPKILVVDDEVNMLKLLQRVLGKEGYELRTSSSSPEAIRLLRDEEYDLVICDLVMPVIGGLDLMQESSIQYEVWHVLCVYPQTLVRMAQTQGMAIPGGPLCNRSRSRS